MIKERYELAQKHLVSAKEFLPFPKYRQREKFDNISSDVKEAILELGNEYLAYEYKVLPATMYMEHQVNGDREKFETIYFQRRTAVWSLLRAEIIKGDGTYIDDIINGVWAICEESTWIIPAHNSYSYGDFHATFKLPNTPINETNFVDLFAAETGSLLAWIVYFLRDRLDEKSPQIVERITFELKRRITTPFIQNIMFWMGLDEHGFVNNWNPWILSNVLTVVLTTEEDEETRQTVISKACTCLDQFLNMYDDDGGCDEGPGYWNAAGASLFDCLEILCYATDDKLNLFDEPIIAQIGKYIERMYIGNDFFVDFADSSAKVIADAIVINRYGKRVRDKGLEDFGAYLFQKNKDNINIFIQDPMASILFRKIQNIFAYKDIKMAKPDYKLLSVSYMDGIEVLTARSKEYFLAVKGGHNNESHNHNDIGNFIVYYDGYPVLIDVGVETYTKKTFSNHRYEIWTMQSSYHNLPEINGVAQRNGEEYRATDVRYSNDDRQTTLSLDIAKAYPEEANVMSYNRTVSLHKGDADRPHVTVEDSFVLSEEGTVEIHLMLLYQPQVRGDKLVVSIPSGKGGQVEVAIKLSDDLNLVAIEEIEMLDKRLYSSWETDEAYRVKLSCESSSGNIGLCIG